MKIECRWVVGNDTLPCGEPQNGYKAAAMKEHNCQDTHGLRRSGRWVRAERIKDPRDLRPRQAFGEWRGLDSTSIRPKDVNASLAFSDPGEPQTAVAGIWVSTPKPSTSLTKNVQTTSGTEDG